MVPADRMSVEIKTSGVGKNDISEMLQPIEMAHEGYA